MNGPFKVGDLVVCVNLSTRLGDAPDRVTALSLLRLGHLYRVEGIVAGDVHLAGVRPPNGWAYAYARFRHLPKADDQFIQQMRAIKPVREGVSA